MKKENDGKKKISVPMRMCISCRKMFHKSQLIRLVKTGEKCNNIVIDETQKLQTRGAYLCNNPVCIEALKKNKALNRAFKCAVSIDDVFNCKKQD